MRAVPLHYEFYLGICLTTEKKHGKSCQVREISVMSLNKALITKLHRKQILHTYIMILRKCTVVCDHGNSSSLQVEYRRPTICLDTDEFDSTYIQVL
jgi:hypothetical protein